MARENLTSRFTSKVTYGLGGAFLGAAIGLLGWRTLYSDWASFILDWPIPGQYFDLIWQTLLDGSDGPSPSTLAIIIGFVVMGLGAMSGVVWAVYQPKNPIWRVIVSSLISGVGGLVLFGIDGFSFGLAGMAIGVNTGVFVNFILWFLEVAGRKLIQLTS
jgi:hypothetical protein